MKKTFILITTIFILSACSGTDSSVNEIDNKLKVAATIFPISDIATTIGGDKLEVISILPAAASPHTFDFSPSGIYSLEGSKVVFSVGHGLDGWIEDMVANVTSDAEVYTVDAGIQLMKSGEHTHEHEGRDEDNAHDEDEEKSFDPHYWLSASNGMIIATNIADKLSELDPLNKDYYMTNLQAFKSELENVDAEIKKILKDEIETKELIVFHDSWNYFAEEYGLEIVGTFEPSPGKEPTPQYLENLYNEASFHGLSSVFSEPQLSSEVLDPFIEDLGLKIFVLDPVGGLSETMSYKDLLLYNARTIAAAL